MKNRLIVLTILAFFGLFSGVEAQNGTMGWVFLDPGAENGGCTSVSDCENDIVCYGLQYTPQVAGTLTSYTTGWFITCTSGGAPIVGPPFMNPNNASCSMVDNSQQFDVCVTDGFQFTNSSGNSGSAVNNTVEPGLTYIIHQVCFTIPPGETILIIEDEITNLTANIDLSAGGSVTDFPTYSTYEVNRDIDCLPIELLSFDVIKKGETAVSNWVTLAELDNDYYEVERSADGKVFNTIGKVEGAGTTYNKQNYSFVDESPLSGINYYRLKQVDYDGQFSYSRVRSLYFEGKDISLSIYPNPARNEVTLSTGTKKGEVTLIIMDPKGQFVYTKIYEPGDWKKSTQLDLKNMVEGMYMIEIIEGNRTETARFVKVN